MAGPEYGSQCTSTSDIGQILASEGVEFLLSGDAKVPISSCNGKVICVFFSANWCRPCRTFIPQLVNVYNGLKSSKLVEIIFISFDKDENGFNEHFKCMPWLALPFNVNLRKKLSSKYCVDRIPSLVSLSCDGISIKDDLVGLIEDYGTEAFPFTRERREQLKAEDEAKRQGGIQQLFGHEEHNYVIANDGRKICVSDLVGKTIGLYFGAQWCPPCHAFTEQLRQVYDELKNSSEGHIMEIIFVSTDRDGEEFNANISKMPWLAIPYQDRTRQDLCRIFNIKGIPSLVLLGKDGKTISTNGKALISLYGAMAFPFTESKIAETEAVLRKEGDGLAHRLKDIKHQHLLELDMTKAYVCDSCKMHGRFWVFSCHVCDYDLHPACVQQSY